MEKQCFDLDERLVAFAVQISALIESLPSTITTRHLSGQLIRSGTSPALNYGEAKGAESPGDFIHKMKIVLKELNESFNTLKILKQTTTIEGENSIDDCLTECNELISIFVKSVISAEKYRKGRNERRI